MTVRGLLIDLEGVLYQEGKVIVGARDAIQSLRKRGLDVRYLTNTTTRSRREIVARMRAMSFEVQPAQVFSPALAAGRLLANAGLHRLHLAAAPTLAEDFADFELVDERPDAVVMGDLHTGFTWDRLDGLFKMLLEGARLVALHRNRFCRRGEELALDLGPFVAAMEYAADTKAIVVGKPSEAFFYSAVDDMKLDRKEVAMIGDDIEADIGGAIAAGLIAVQVRTGKYSRRDEDHPHVQASDRIQSIADLESWLAKLPHP